MSIDEFSAINFIDNKNVAVKIKKIRTNYFSNSMNINYFNYSVKVLIQNLDKFDIPRGKFRKLNDLEILNLKSLSTSPFKSSSY